ncbi:MAG: zinc ribbon domain-containing protein [Deltaproteobacteria bacterium]|nr:zinc ribbon domain-containing protein [Deltaproteobacteria bacterium]
MECPHCQKEIPGEECPECGQIVPLQGKYCMMCGARIAGESQQTAETEGQEDAFDIENRVLCPDGTCTGIIIDGKCSECGMHYSEKQEP